MSRGWPFSEADSHEHVWRDVDTTTLSTGEIEVEQRCLKCPRLRRVVMDRDEAKEDR